MPKKKRLKSRKERNKNRKNSIKRRKSSLVKRSLQPLTTSTTPSATPLTLKPTAETKDSKPKAQLARLSLTSRHEKSTNCHKCLYRRPLQVRDYLDSVAHSYIQAGLVDASIGSAICKETDELSSQANSSTSLTSDKCNSNHSLQESSNEESTNQKYSLFGMSDIFIFVFFIANRDIMTAL